MDGIVANRCVPDQPGVSAALFEPLAARNVVVDMIVQNTSTEGHTDISFTVPKADMNVSEQIVGQVATEIGAKVFTHDAKEREVMEAVRWIDGQQSTRAPTAVIRIEGSLSA